MSYWTFLKIQLQAIQKQLKEFVCLSCLADDFAIARNKHKEKMNEQHIADEVDQMTDEEFLDTMNEAITRCYASESNSPQGK